MRLKLSVFDNEGAAQLTNRAIERITFAPGLIWPQHTTLLFLNDVFTLGKKIKHVTRKNCRKYMWKICLKMVFPVEMKTRQSAPARIFSFRPPILLQMLLRRIKAFFWKTFRFSISKLRNFLTFRKTSI